MNSVRAETRELVRQGHKCLLMVAGEAYAKAAGGFNYVLDAIRTVYELTEAHGHIRRLNVNLAPLTVDEFARLSEAGIGTYQLFQKTYHRPAYAAVHLSGKKCDFDWRVTAFDRAMRAGIDDVGMGVLRSYRLAFRNSQPDAVHRAPRKNLRCRLPYDQRAV